MREHVKKKKKTFLPDLIRLARYDSRSFVPPVSGLTILSRPDFSLGLKRKKERKIHKFASFHLSKLYYDILSIVTREKKGRTIAIDTCVTSAIVPQKKKCLRIRNKRVSSTFVRLNRWQSPQCCRLVSGSTEEREFRWVPSSGYYFVLMLRDDHAW